MDNQFTSVNYDSSCTELMQAINSGKTEKALSLIEAGADIHARSNHAQFTPLHLAVHHKNIDIVDALIKKGADVNTVCSQGETPLHVAVTYGYKDIAGLLRAAGARE